jgi:prolipoprotein diacylglyceryltransferase
MLAILIIIGRLGCFSAGLDDYTYGIQTTLPWGFDFGDGINRHPVQLYESLALLLFITLFLYQYPKNKIFWHQNGFYVFIIFYASQRFIWEFLKPYEQVFGAFNLFHILTILLIVYATIFLTKIKKIVVND